MKEKVQVFAKSLASDKASSSLHCAGGCSYKFGFVQSLWQATEKWEEERRGGFGTPRVVHSLGALTHCCPNCQQLPFRTITVNGTFALNLIGPDIST